MNKKRSVLPIVLCAVGVLAVIGLGFALNIVRREGLENIWKRKKAIIEKTHPVARPFIDDAENRVRKGQIDER